MNKTNYTAPTIRVVHLNVKYHLLDPSVTKANMGDGLKELEMGGTTTSADSRRRSIWGDEDD